MGGLSIRSRLHTSFSLPFGTPSPVSYSPKAQHPYAKNVPAHQRLFNSEHKILHRDISHNNILLGKPNAPEGRRGILIDFDLAVVASGPDSVLVDWKMVRSDSSLLQPLILIPPKGTRLFQSCTVLLSRLGRKNRTPAHDYIDDLQSFFYVLCYLLLVHRPDGTRLPSDGCGPALVKAWGDDEPVLALSAKQRFIVDGPLKSVAPGIIEETWGPVVRDMFVKFFNLIRDIMNEKDEIVLKQFNFDPSTLTDLHAKSDAHYSQALRILDDALRELEPSRTSRSDQRTEAYGSKPTSIPSPEECRPEPSPPLSPPLKHTTPTTTDRKRRSEEEEHPESRQPKSKRLNVEVSAPTPTVKVPKYS